jgi:sulfoxide reductase heme-binding subunit YedZ
MWAFGRSSGIIALILLTVALLLGVVTRSGRPLPGLPRFSISVVHRNTALLSVVFLVLHIGTLLLDSYAHLNLADAFVPFIGADKPFWLGLGTLAFDLVLAVIITALLRQRIGTRAFRAFHWLVYAMWPIALLHGVFEGTNGTSGWFLLGAGVSTVAVIAAVVWRISSGFMETSAMSSRRREETPAPDFQLRRIP